MPKPLQLAAFFAALGIGLALKCVDYNAEDGKEAKTWDCRKGEKCMVSYNFITKSYESGGCTPDLIDLVCRVENHVLQCGCSPINCDMTDAYKADIRSRKDCWTVSHNNTVRTFYKLHWSCPADDKCLMPFRKASWDDPARERSQDIFWHEESLYQYICGKGQSSECANPQEAYKKADYPLETPTEKPPTTPAATTTTKAVNGSTSASANASSSTPPDAKLTKASSTTMKSTPKKRLKRAATAASTKLSPVYTCDCSAGGGIDCARNFATMMYIHGVSPGRTHQEYVCFYEQRECPRANVIDQQFAGWKTSS